MPTLLESMPIQNDVVDSRTGKIAEIWRTFFRKAATAIGASAPVDAGYLVTRPNTELSSESNLGALASGYLKLTVALGIATPSTVAGLPAADLTGALPAISGAALTGLLSTQLGDVASGVYTPTLTNVANLDSTTAYQCQYVRVGSVVTVSGRVDVDPTAGATDTKVGISLPIASNISQAYDCCGCGNAALVSGQAAAILGDAANDRATMEWRAVDTTNQPMFFTFTYRVI